MIEGEEDAILAVLLLLDRAEEDDVIKRAMRWAFNDARAQGYTNETIAAKLGVEVSVIDRLYEED
mgnify:CR=1 FL=1